MTENDFIEAIIAEARVQGYTIENSRNGRQIVFDNKKLHEKHLRLLHPEILANEADIPSLIETVAPGRPCTHRPMKEILSVVTV